MKGSTNPVEAADEVDHIVAAWRRERPDLDPEPLHVLSRVHRISRRLDRSRSAVFAAHDLDPFEFDVLAALRRSGPPYSLSPGQLAAATLVASGTMTNRIDRLSGREFVVRERDPHDGRGVLVRLTDSGRDTVDAALAGLLEHERSLLSGLDEGSRVLLADLLRRLALTMS